MPRYRPKNNFLLLFVLFVLFVLFSAWGSAQEIYRWTDSQGRQHISDRPPFGDTAPDMTLPVKEKKEPAIPASPARPLSQSLTSGLGWGIKSESLPVEGHVTDNPIGFSIGIAGTSQSFTMLNSSKLETPSGFWQMTHNGMLYIDRQAKTLTYFPTTQLLGLKLDSYYLADAQIHGDDILFLLGPNESWRFNSSKGQEEFSLLFYRGSDQTLYHPQLEYIPNHFKSFPYLPLHRLGGFRFWNPTLSKYVDVSGTWQPTLRILAAPMGGLLQTSDALYFVATVEHYKMSSCHLFRYEWATENISRQRINCSRGAGLISTDMGAWVWGSQKLMWVDKTTNAITNVGSAWLPGPLSVIEQATALDENVIAVSGRGHICEAGKESRDRTVGDCINPIGAQVTGVYEKETSSARFFPGKPGQRDPRFEHTRMRLHTSCNTFHITPEKDPLPPLDSPIMAISASHLHDFHLEYAPFFVSIGRGKSIKEDLYLADPLAPTRFAQLTIRLSDKPRYQGFQLKIYGIREGSPLIELGGSIANRGNTLFLYNVQTGLYLELDIVSGFLTGELLASEFTFDEGVGLCEVSRHHVNLQITPKIELYQALGETPLEDIRERLLSQRQLAAEANKESLPSSRQCIVARSLVLTENKVLYPAMINMLVQNRPETREACHDYWAAMMTLSLPEERNQGLFEMLTRAAANGNEKARQLLFLTDWKKK